MSMSKTLRAVLAAAACVLAVGINACDAPPKSAQPPQDSNPQAKTAADRVVSTAPAANEPTSAPTTPIAPTASQPATRPTSAPATASAPTSRPTATAAVRDLQQMPLYQFTEDEFGAYIGELAKRMPDVGERIADLARKNLGQPYQMYLLGEYPYEIYDPDPIYNLARSDCLTFVEHTLSAALSTDFMGYLRLLQRIRYKDGVIGMLTRNHYTEADWNPNNAYLLDDVTNTLSPAELPVHETLVSTIKRAAFFSKFGIGLDVPDEEFHGTYIPTAKVEVIAPALRTGDVIEIVRGDSSSQWVGHVGFLLRGPDGTANFLHSANPRVREQPLMDYLANDKRCVGIKVLRLRDEPVRRAADALRDAKNATPVDDRSLSAAMCDVRGMLRKRYDAAFKADLSRPCSLDWKPAMSLQAYRLDYDTPTDPQLQSTLDALDRKVGEELGIPEGDRALGVLDVTDLRFAAVRPDALFYGASVPKLNIVHAYMEKFPHEFTEPDEELNAQLSRVLKRSDNALAAQFAQRAGLDYIQNLITSDRYRFYDKDHGGGMWVGKFYGVDEPRVADPVGGHSHAVTVRQCLRFYLCMEQMQLGDARRSAMMQMMMAAPKLTFHNENFVKGLAGRNATLIRKSGTWEDWHLDTARVRHNNHTYLIAGATHHAKGREYLAQMIAGLDDYLAGKDTVRWPYRHMLYLHDDESAYRAIPDGRTFFPVGEMLLKPAGNEQHYVLSAVNTDMPFNEALPSWNVDVPAGVGVVVEMRVCRYEEQVWSPWMRLATYGDAPVSGDVVGDFRMQVGEDEFVSGRIDVDYFRSDDQFTGYQLQVRAANPNPQPITVRIARAAMTISDTTPIPSSLPPRIADSGSKFTPTPGKPPAPWQKRLAVLFRSQKVEKPEISGRICSPTSLAMVLDYRGVNQPTQAVCDLVFDKPHDIYGNWPFNVQAAYKLGVPGYLARFSNWRDVENCIAVGQPLIVSIRSETEGELRGAPYKKTDGHLLVICGFDADGKVCVNDPAASTPEKGVTSYEREDLERVWMRATGGVAYVLMARPTASQPTTSQPATSQPTTSRPAAVPRSTAPTTTETPASKPTMESPK